MQPDPLSYWDDVERFTSALSWTRRSLSQCKFGVAILLISLWVSRDRYRLSCCRFPKWSRRQTLSITSTVVISGSVLIKKLSISIYYSFVSCRVRGTRGSEKNTNWDKRWIQAFNLWWKARNYSITRFLNIRNPFCAIPSKNNNV